MILMLELWRASSIIHSNCPAFKKRCKHVGSGTTSPNVAGQLSCTPGQCSPHPQTAQEPTDLFYCESMEMPALRDKMFTNLFMEN